MGEKSLWLRHRGHRIPIRTGETLIGRSPYCTVVVQGSQVSRQHCALRLEAEDLQVLDLGSTNGTRINGLTIRGSAPLSPGDVLGIGSDTLEILELEATRNSNRDTHSRLDVGPVSPTSPEPVTLTGSTTLELIEALVESKVGPEVAQRVAQTVQRIVNELLDSSRRGQDSNHVGRRLLDVSDKVASWFQDGQLDEWRNRVRRRLER